ncbi:hypothetical protein Tco_0536148 [Tanacetum coccineum]
MSSLVASTTNYSAFYSSSSSPVKTSDNLEEFADEITPLKIDVHFMFTLKPLFEFDDNFTSSNVNPLFNEMDVDVENKNSNVSDSDEPVLLNTPLSNKDECFAPEDDIDEIDAFLAMEVSSNFEEGYFDSEGDVTFLDNLLSDDTTHNLAPEVISDHEPEQNESSITFSPRSDPLHHEFAGELLTLPSRNDREFEDYLNRMTVLCEISTFRSQENVHANQRSIIESLPVSPIPVEDSDPVQEEIDIFLVPDDLIPPGVENDDSEDEDIELPNNDHQDDPSIPRPPPEPPDVEKCLEPEAGVLITKVFKGVSKPHDFMADILPTLPTLVSDLTFILFLSSFLSFGSEDTIFDPGISTFHFYFKTREEEHVGRVIASSNKLIGPNPHGVCHVGRLKAHKDGVYIFKSSQKTHQQGVSKKDAKLAIRVSRGGNFNQGQVYQPPTNQPPVYQVPPYQAPTPQIQGVSKTDFENYVKANDAVLKNVQNQGQNLQNQMANVTSLLTSLCNNFKNSASTSNSGTLPSQTVTNPREQINAITTRSGKTCEGPSTPLVPTPVVSTPQKEPEQNPETSMDKVQKPSSESTAQVPPPEKEDSIFMEIPKPKAKKTVNIEIQDLNSPRPNSYQSKLPYPERMKVRENDKPSAQHSRFLKMFKQLRLEIGLKDALVEMPKFNKWLSSLLRNKEKLEDSI